LGTWNGVPATAIEICSLRPRADCAADGYEQLHGRHPRRGRRAASGTLALGAITREGWGVVRFPTRTGPITTSAATVNGILGAWAFTGSGTAIRYATVAGGTIAARRVSRRS
jgi:hypothetical protein